MTDRASRRIAPIRISVVVAVVLAAGWIAIARPYGPIGTAVWLAFLVMIGLVVVAIPGVGDSTPVPVRPPGVPLPERWAAACVAHDDVLSAYGAYELDPEFLLKYPGLTDLKAPPVMNFHDALELADTLRTDTYPGDAKATEYLGAVSMLRTDWSAAERYATSDDAQLRPEQGA